MSGKGFSTYYVFLGVITFLSHRRLFKYFKTRHSCVQLAVLNNAVRARGRLNSLLYNVDFLKKCLENSVAPRGIQRRVKKSKVYHSAVIERAFVRDELEKSRVAVIRAKINFQRIHKQTRSILNLCDFIRFSWFLSGCDRRERASLAVRQFD